jgi:hypothetical protein
MISRIGTNIVYYISCMCYAHITQRRIDYDSSLDFIGSPFVDSLLGWVDEYNSKLTIYQPDELSPHEKYCLFSGDLMLNLSFVTLRLGTDIRSYFREHIRPGLKERLKSVLDRERYVLSYDPDNTLVVHLRLDDVSQLPDYDGRISSDYYMEKINNGYLCKISEVPTNLNAQTPLNAEKIMGQVSAALEIYPSLSVVIVTSPMSRNHPMPINCPVICNTDVDNDLYQLMGSKYLIISRSTFSLSATYLGDQTYISSPLWGIFASSGLGSKFDRGNLKYFY